LIRYELINKVKKTNKLLFNFAFHQTSYQFVFVVQLRPKLTCYAFSRHAVPAQVVDA